MSDINGTWSTLMGRHSEMRDLALDDCRIDMRFQRAVNPNSLNRIKAEYHPAGIGHILVAGVEPERAGEARYAVVDGQTRFRALLELNAAAAHGETVPDGLLTTIKAEVFPDMTADEAALLFRLRNAQMTVPPGDRGRIARTAGDPLMESVHDQCEAAGYIVFSDDWAERPPTIEPTSKMLEVLSRLIVWGKKYKRPNLLTEALNIQADAFRTPGATDLRGTVHPQILQATADLLRKNENLVESELAVIMRTQGDLLFDAGTRKKDDKIRMSKAIQLVLVERYNLKKSPKERIHV